MVGSLTYIIKACLGTLIGTQVYKAKEMHEEKKGLERFMFLIEICTAVLFTLLISALAKRTLD